MCKNAMRRRIPLHEAMPNHYDPPKPKKPKEEKQNREATEAMINGNHITCIEKGKHGHYRKCGNSDSDDELSDVV